MESTCCKEMDYGVNHCLQELLKFMIYPLEEIGTILCMYVNLKDIKEERKVLSQKPDRTGFETDSRRISFIF